MSGRFDAWGRGDMEHSGLVWRRPDRVPGLRGGAAVDWPSFRRRLKAIDPVIDVMALLNARSVEIVQMDTDPPTRLWSNLTRMPDGQISCTEVGDDTLDMVLRATWQTRAMRERENARIQYESHLRDLRERQDVARAFQQAADMPNRVSSSGALHR